MPRTRLFPLIFALLLVFSFAACADRAAEADLESSPEEPETEEELSEYPVTVQGVTVMARPSRVVSLSPALTEKLYDIGLQDSLVGVSDYCDYPAPAASFTKCGTAQIPNIERIKGLDPHVVIAQADLSEEDAMAFEQAAIDVVIVPPARSIRELSDSYIALARLFEGEYAGTELGENFARTLQGQVEALQNRFVPYAEQNGRKKALYLRLLDFTVATGDTLENELLAAIGLENIAEGQEGWLYPDDLANGEGRAQFESVEIIFMDEKFVTIKMLEQSPYYKSLNATIKDLYVYVDSLVLERQSLRSLDVLAQMGAAAYPEASEAIPFAEEGGGEEESE